jgi:hypothetical protein
MSSTIYLITVALVPVTILLVFAIRAVSSVLQARAKLANDGAYRQLAERATAAQAETASALAAIQAAMADVRSRLTAVEKVLKEVE